MIAQLDAISNVTTQVNNYKITLFEVVGGENMKFVMMPKKRFVEGYCVKTSGEGGCSLAPCQECWAYAKA